jgi:hypothetical protein
VFLHGLGRAGPSIVDEGDAGVGILLLVATEPHVDRRAADVERFRAALPRAEVREIVGGEHNLLATRPDETMRAVGDVLRAVTMARA